MRRAARLTGIALAWFGFASALSDDTVPRRAETVGSVGCSAAACHGRPDIAAFTQAPGKDCWKSSAILVHALDPHQKAYAVLKSPLGKQIAEKLKAGPNQTVIPAHEDPRCLACHVNPSLAGPNGNVALREDGVSCEACHGDASLWQAEHTAWRNWSDRLPFYEKGFRELNVNRAAICAGCHVGASGEPARDMNHDMIAVGHPALDKSFETLMSRLPKHWQERNREKPGEQRLESGDAGFVAALKALGLDREKRSRTDSRTPWPELAQLKCVDCHHNLQGK